MLSGEEVPDAAQRILHEEAGIHAAVKWVSTEYVIETFEVGELDEQESALYSNKIELFHYFSIPVYLKTLDDAEVIIDAQSKRFQWSRENISTHSYVAQYFDMWKRQK